MSRDARLSHIVIDIDPDVRVRITPPRMIQDSGGQPVRVPWYVHLGHTANITTDDRAALVALRDALTAALNTHPDDASTDETEDVS